MSERPEASPDASADWLRYATDDLEMARRAMALRSLRKRVPKEGDVLRVPVDEMIGTLLVYKRNVPTT